MMYLLVDTTDGPHGRQGLANRTDGGQVGQQPRGTPAGGTGQVAANLAKQATARVREFAQKHCTVASPGREEFRRAAELAGDDALKLSAGDALHLAIAASLNAQGILCLDDAMIESAEALGM